MIFCTTQHYNVKNIKINLAKTLFPTCSNKNDSSELSEVILGAQKHNQSEICHKWSLFFMSHLEMYLKQVSYMFSMFLFCHTCTSLNYNRLFIICRKRQDVLLFICLILLEEEEICSFLSV